MNEQEKQTYLKQYKKAKEKGVPFFPDILFKDAIVVLLIFLILVALAYFVGAPLDARADPADTSYTPRPEWYFMFLFQLLKYFPGKLEVVGVIVIPTLAILGLLALPFLDRSKHRHFLRRPLVTIMTTLSMAGIITLTVLAMREAPPPAETAPGDETAVLYTTNCAGCHGDSVSVPPGTNLHDIIAQGSHEGMPAWNADLTNDQIDALAGFILSPTGNRLFAATCGTCHEVSELVSSDPIALKDALVQGSDYSPHTDVVVPTWTDLLNQEERAALLNFLVAPDGQRLFATNCASCHGRFVSFSGEESDLRNVIAQGGKHLKMPPWRERLTSAELDSLSKYVVDPSSVPNATSLFTQYCTECHGQRIPTADNFADAYDIIATGGAHETMPVWGDVLTPEQLDALVQYTLSSASGEPVELGQELFAENCVSCHGDFGEGGPNPTRPDDVIAPISTAEYLKTRDDATLRAVISQGQPNFGMSPFGTSFGGPLDDSEIDSIVQYIRSWEADPPVELPPEVDDSTVSISGAEIFTDVCAQCHDPLSENFVGITLRDPDFRANNTDQDIFDTINLGHEATPMIAWGEILSAEQIQDLVKFIRQLPVLEVTDPEPTGPSFAVNILPLLESRCFACHESDGDGNWNAATYEEIMTTGDNAPVIIPGDVENSLLAQKIQDIQEEGKKMPPLRSLPDDEIQLILDWIAAGASNN